MNRNKTGRAKTEERRAIAIGFVLALFGLRLSLFAADAPAGFFVEDLHQNPPAPAFYNVEAHRLQPFPLRQSYNQFIDFYWDHDHGRVFFSAQQSPRDPFRVYMKMWPDGEEKVVYENPLGPFRFLLSPDGNRFALQVMGPAAWPILAVHDWTSQHGTYLGQGYSPDWSSDGQRLLFLRIPGSLPSWLGEYRVDTDTATQILDQPVMEAAYTEDPDQIILKTAAQAKKCDVFQIWNRHNGRFRPFTVPDRASKTCPSQRELGAFPGHQFFFFKEAESPTDLDDQKLVVTDLWGGRLQELARDDWAPRVTAVDPTTLLVGEDPLYVLSADGAGGRIEIPDVEMVHPRQIMK